MQTRSPAHAPAVIAALASWALGACGGGGSSAAGPVADVAGSGGCGAAAARLDEAGGTLTLETCLGSLRATLVVPPLAFNEPIDVVMTVVEDAAPPGWRPVGPAIRVHPAAATLAAPGALTLPLQAPGTGPVLVWAARAGDAREPTHTAADQVTLEVSAIGVFQPVVAAGSGTPDAGPGGDATGTDTVAPDVGPGADTVGVDAGAPPDTIGPPLSPEITEVVAVTQTVALAWSPVAGATAYIVYLGSGPDVGPGAFDAAATVASSPHVLTPVADGTPVWVTVTALAGAAESEPAAAVTVTPQTRVEPLLASQLPGGGVAGGAAPDVSATGQFVALQSNAPLAGGAGPTGAEVFLYDATAGAAELISIGPASQPSSPYASQPRVSGDGRFVVFATPSAWDGAGGVGNIYLRDRQAQTTERVSVATGGGAPDGECHSASVSDDGRYVGFIAGASNLVVGGTPTVQFYLRDRQLGVTQLVTKSVGGVQPNGLLRTGLVAAGGGHAVVVAQATDLVADPPLATKVDRVYVWEASTQALTLASLDPTGDPVDGSGAAIGADGRFVAFVTSAPSIAKGPWAQVALRDRLLGTTEAVSVALDGASMAASACSQPDVSDDGRYVAFSSAATNLTPNAPTQQAVFIRDRLLGVTVLVSLAPDGGALEAAADWASMSRDGAFVVFTSLAPSLGTVPGVGSLVLRYANPLLID